MDIPKLALISIIGFIIVVGVVSCVRVTAISDKCKYVQVDMGGAVDIVSHDCSEKPK